MLFFSSPLSAKSFVFFTIKTLLLLVSLTVVIGGGFLLWQHYFPVVANNAWQYRVVHNNIEKASAIYQEQDGSLIVAEELNKSQGRIIRIEPNGERSVLFKNLNKPDGITPYAGGIVFSQEGGVYPVNWLKDGKVYNLFQGTNVQGLIAEGNFLYAVEDRGPQSRILRYDSTTKQVEVIRENLNEAETLAICPNGQKFYNEKEANRVRLLTADGSDPIILNHRKTREPSILKCNSQGLWITEDSTHRARLMLLRPDGKLKVILSHLKAPQQLLEIEAGKYLLAEGGRDRIIEIEEIN